MSFDPTSASFVDDYIAPDDFIGTITRVRLAPRTFSRNSVKYGLFPYVDITPDPDSEFKPFRAYYSGGFLNRYTPSVDGKTPVADIADFQALEKGEAAISDEEQAEGKYEGTRTIGDVLPKNTDWHQFLIAMNDCGFRGWGEESTCMEGIRARFKRVPQQFKRAPKKGADPNQREFMVLVPVELVDAANAGKAVSSSTTKGANGPAAAATNPADEELVTQMILVVGEQLAKAGGKASKGKLATPVMNSFDTAQRAKVLSIYQTNEFLTHPAASWTFDASKSELVANS